MESLAFGTGKAVDWAGKRRLQVTAGARVRPVCFGEQARFGVRRARSVGLAMVHRSSNEGQ